MKNTILLTTIVSILSMAQASAAEERSKLFGPTAKKAIEPRSGALDVGGRKVLFSPKSLKVDDRASRRHSSKSDVVKSDGRRLLFKSPVSTEVKKKVVSNAPVKREKISSSDVAKPTRKLLFSSAEKVGVTQSRDVRIDRGPEAKGTIDASSLIVAQKRESLRRDSEVAAPKVVVALPEPGPVTHAPQVRNFTLSGQDVFAARKKITSGFNRGLLIAVFAESAGNRLASDLNFLPLMNLLSRNSGLVITPSYGFSTVVFKQQILENKYSVAYLPKALNAAASAAGLIPFAKLQVAGNGNTGSINPSFDYAWWVNRSAVDEKTFDALESTINSLGTSSDRDRMDAVAGHQNAIGVPGVFTKLSGVEARKILVESNSVEKFRPGLDFDERLAAQNRLKSPIFTVKKR